MTGTSTSSKTTSTRSHANGSSADDSTDARAPMDAVISGAQNAADVARQTAAQAAARLPDAYASAQVYARDTQKTLNAMDQPTLLAGTTFSLGLAIGLFLSGAHRLLVTAAILPAVAMALTLIGREPRSTGTTRSSAKS